MNRWLRTRSSKVALGAATVLGVGIGFSPLLGLHGVESALVLGVFLAPFVALAAARTVVHARADGLSMSVGAMLRRALPVTFAVWAIPIALLALNAVRFTQCAPWEGLAFELLGPGVGLFLAAVCGIAIAIAVPMPRLASTLACLLPVGALLLGVHRFWDGPAIFVFGHFGGWFPGTIYDEGVVIPDSLLTFRASTLCLSFGILTALSALVDPGSGAIVPARILSRKARFAFALVLLAGFATAEAFDDELGHDSSSEFISEELGATIEGRRCVVHAPRELRPTELRRLRDDCDHRVETAEQTLGVTQRTPVTAFFFRNADEKQRYMGAASTFIAKPWRDEVYLQLREWPHPVLHHEIVHVVAGETAEGPFDVGGSLGGWLPDPSLIEGVAVAAAWEERDGLTPHQWARAMLELELMPTLDSVVGLSFLTQPARNAYTVSGSFIRYLLDEYGADVVREAYRTGDLPGAAGKPLSELETEWRAFLATVELPPEALALAELRFSRSSIFSAVCPHVVARLKSELQGDLAAGDHPRAQSTCEALLQIDPYDSVTRAYYAGTLARTGDREAARVQLDALRDDPPAPPPVQALAVQAIADAEWALDEPQTARAMYEELLRQPQTDDSARQIEVRLLALGSEPRIRRMLFDMLIGDEGGASSTTAVHLASELGLARDDGLGPYLEARQLIFQSRYDLALPLIREAKTRGLPTRRLVEENRRMEGTALFAIGRLSAAEEVFGSIAADPQSSEGERVAAQDWLRRIEWAVGRGPGT